MRGDASLFSAIIVAAIFIIAVSTIYYYLEGLNLYQSRLFSSISRIAMDLSARVWFEPNGSTIYMYSDRSIGVLGIMVYGSSGLVYYNISGGNAIAYISPGSPLDLSRLLPSNIFSIVASGQAYLGVIASNGMIYTYKYILSNNNNMNSSSSDVWITGLLAVARGMPDIVYTAPGTYWFSGDEAMGSVRVTFARNLVIGDGVTLYIADPTPRRTWIGVWPGGVELHRIEALGGIGVTRIIVADTIAISGTLSSKGLGGAGNILYSYIYPSGQRCGDWLTAYGDLANGGTVASAGGGGTGAQVRNTNTQLYCRGLGGGSASLFDYTAPGGWAGGYGLPMDGVTIDYRAFIKTLMISPYQLSDLSLYGAGGGSGGPGDAGLYTWNDGGPGGRGGGGIMIICNKLILNNGVIDASGESGGTPSSPNGGGGGGGAAGAIFIYCNSVEGTGIIKAIGGLGGAGNGYGGKGGRGGDGWVVVVASSISPGIIIDVGSGYKLITTG
ncbi:MAG: hypothetical protein QXE01_11255 [Sulfolobales archaeon]